MSEGCLVRDFTSIVDTVPLPWLVTNAVARHRPRPATAATSSGTTLTSAPDNPNINTPRTRRNRRIAAPRLVALTSSCCRCPSPATRRDRHPDGARADWDVGEVLFPALDVDRRHRVAAGIGDEGGLAVRGNCHARRAQADRDVGGVLGPGHQVNRRDGAGGVV